MVKSGKLNIFCAGIGYTTVRKLYTGHSAALRTARKVSAATGGAITVEQLQAGCR